MEEKADAILSEAMESDVGFLVVGDPFGYIFMLFISLFISPFIYGFIHNHGSIFMFLFQSYRFDYLDLII